MGWDHRVQNKISARGEGDAMDGSVLGPAVPILTPPASPYLASLFGKNLPHPVMDLFSVVLIAGKTDISF